MLDVNLKTQLKTYLQNLKTPVELALYLDESEASQELNALAGEIAELSPMVSARRVENNDDARRPTMGVISVENQSELRFAGIPLGHEFTSLVLALLHSGGHPMKVDESLIETIRQLPVDCEFETYISLSCQNCPEVVQALNMAAVLNPGIRHTMIDGALFQDEVDQRKIMAVPSVYLNGELFAQGRISLQDVVRKLDTQAEKREAEALAKKEDFDVLVVGGGPAGAASAIYAARKGIRTGVVADRFGGQVKDTMAIENFISMKETTGPKLVASLEQHVKEYPVDVMDGQRATKLERRDGKVHVTLESGATLASRSVILATGARWREMNVPGEQEYRGKGVAYCPHCDGPLFKGKSVAVIGGGNSGIEAAIDLAGIVEHVTVLEFDSKLRADEVLQKRAKSLPNVDIVMQAQTTEVVGDGDKVTAIRYLKRDTNENVELALAGVFVQIGLVPNSEFLKDSVALTERGEIIVSAAGETSMPGVFAAGDVTNIPFKQIIIAMGHGATAALGAFDHLIRSPLESDETGDQQASNDSEAA